MRFDNSMVSILFETFPLDEIPIFYSRSVKHLLRIASHAFISVILVHGSMYFCF